MPNEVTVEKLQAEVAILREGLEAIIRHQEIISGTLVNRSTVVYIARKALKESKGQTQ